MIKQWVERSPFWAFYWIAISIPVILFSYLIILEVYYQSVNGADFSFFSNVFSIRDQLASRYPVLFHNGDSVILYLSWYVIMPLGLPMICFPLAPTLAALTVTAVSRGKEGLKYLLSLYKPVRGNLSPRNGVKIYLSMLAFLVAMISLACLREYFWGEPQRVSAALNQIGFIDWKVLSVTLLMALFFNQGGLLEELGWRGYALPLMIERWGSPLLATLLLGVAWALWHFPREIPTLLSGQYDALGLLSQQGWFILLCCSMSVIATYFVNITGGSVLPAIMIHGVLNLVGGMFGRDQVGVRGVFTQDVPLMWLCAALVLLLVVGKDLGWQKRKSILGEG